MKKISIFLILLLLLTGCGRISETVQNTGNTSPNAGILDTSDLEPDGSYTQELAIGYSMPQGVPAPSIVFSRYRSKDGETFMFDEQGRLRRYWNTDEIFFNKSYAGEPVLTQEEMQAKAEEVLSSVTEDYAAFKQTDFSYYPKDSDERISYSLTMESEHFSGVSDYAFIRLDHHGEVSEISIDYNEDNSVTPRRALVVMPSDKSYFEEQLQSYLEAYHEKSSYVNYEVEDVYYLKSGSTLYAMYTIVFEDEQQPKMETPPTWVNQVTFVREK